MIRIDAPFRSRRATGGFSLIELMIVTAILGILAMIAVPSYEKYQIRSKRAVAKQFLLAVASKQEQYLLDARTYATTLADLGLTAPAELTNFYAFSFAACAAPCTTYTITATPQGTKGPPSCQGQACDFWEPIGKTDGTDVGPLTIDNLGTKSPSAKWAN